MTEDGPSGLRMAGATPDTLEALRLDAAGALERGLGFVMAHGDAFAQLRAQVILQARPVQDATDAVAEHQSGDGSFSLLGLAAAGAPGLREEAARGLPEALLGSLEALVVFAELSALTHPCVEASAAYLGRIQRPDGSWGRDDDEPTDRLYATGMLAGLLGRTRFVRTEVLEASGSFVGDLFSPERVEERDWRSLVAFGVFFTGVHHDLADAALQWIGRALERGFRRRSYDATETLQMLLQCGAMAVPGAELAPAELLHAVLAEQGPDGGFAELAEGGVPARVAPTVDCLKGIIALCDSLS
ncbi:MAG: hypothetical protein JRG92_10005 [Deltaproteobacteria bacterium]|nr:hypothetical protein [Deltaproteobacteria bacterium]MBW2383960.1 hypothetical protein [Deltaproteobacteria bacterium]MBW2697685.1 hypothetical protein [Deltaproteobacteria bacterium]